MKPKPEQELNKLTQNYYQNIAKYWNNEPNYFWSGWSKLISWIQSSSENGQINVLDLGCGNGRFSFFLNQSLTEFQVHYTGVDAVDYYIELASSRQPQNLASYTIYKRDLFKPNWNLAISEPHVITAFGLLHHLPGKQTTDSFMTELSSICTDKTICILTTWQYLDIPRLKKRVLAKNDSRLDSLISHEAQALLANPHSNILDWVKGEQGYRFSHHFSQGEIINLLNSYGFEILTTFTDDDVEANRNRYYICRKIVT